MASPLSISRPNHDDSERIKVLKEVLRSSERCQREFQREFRQSGTGWKVVAGDKPRQRGNSGTKGNGTQSAVNLRDLAHTSRQGLSGDLDGHEHLEVQVNQIDEVGARIGDLCDRLLAPALQMPPKYPPSDWGPHPGMEIIRRADADVKQTRAQTERTTDAYIGENVLFDALEDLADRIERSPGQEELREQFPRRHTHHPNISLFSDYALQAGAPFKEAVWAVSGHERSRFSVAPERPMGSSGGFAANRRAKGAALPQVSSRSNSASESGSDRGGMLERRSSKRRQSK